MKMICLFENIKYYIIFKYKMFLYKINDLMDNYVIKNSNNQDWVNDARLNRLRTNGLRGGLLGSKLKRDIEKIIKNKRHG